MSRLSRLSGRAYERLSPEQRRAVDRLLHWHVHPDGPLDAAGRGEAKTILGWRRTAEETVAYARKLIDGGMDRDAAAIRLGVEADHLRRLLKKGLTPEKPPRKRAPRLEKSGLTDKRQGVGRSPDPNRVMYAGDPSSYDFEAALRRASR